MRGILAGEVEPELVEPDPKLKDEPMEACYKCEGSGRVSADQWEMSLPALQKEAATNDRARLAAKEGVLSLKNCPRCRAVGKVPKGKQRKAT